MRDGTYGEQEKLANWEYNKVDEKKFDSKILELYNNPLKAKEFGRKGFDIFNKKFSSEKYISEHIKTFERYL